ncbi:Bardet-Biedl syndrome 5 protein homolog [Leptopilina heterotoma]|uniref:Bardet-Biedl syndrome 5 protein homolog n=1 Tax=Leptopilina heterotoma TaxID=63436 RepID=UPI001CA9C398|nr:Bardet-Biedl syndrome 5 protein homolog [Leptopilina heterotoma]
MWQNNEVRFDIPFSQIEMRLGEVIIDKLENIEDNKGNAGDRGRLLITNLRIIWHSSGYPRINLSIGYNTFVSVTTKAVARVFSSNTQALYILSSFRSCRYEFLFINLDPKNSRHYTSVLGVYRSYISSKLYREIKLRGAIIHDKRLTILPQENIHSTLHGVWNLSTEQGNVGMFIVTNVRIVWFADMNHQFNVSLSYLVFASVNIRTSKFGPTLVIVSSEASGGYVLGFRIDPVEKLHMIHKEIKALLATYNRSPIFGVDYKPEHNAPVERKIDLNEFSEVEEIAEDEISNALGVYFNDGEESNRIPVYNNYVGLMVEELKEDTTMQQLWELIPSTSSQNSK